MNKLMWVIIAIIVIAGGWYFLGGQSQQGTMMEGEAVTLGFVGPLTGDAASIGTAARSAIEMAVEEINAKGGKLTVIYEDGKCNAQAASNAANKLINADKVSAILGGACSTETAAFAPAAMQAKVPVLSYCSSAPNLSETGKYFFRDYPSDAFQGKFAAEYVYNTLGAKKVAVIYHISEWGTGIKNVFVARFEELGGEIVLEEGTPQTARDYRTQLTKVKAANPDYLYAPTYPEGGIALLNQLKELGITTKVFSGDAWGDSKVWSEGSGKADILYTEPKPASAEDFRGKLLAKIGGQEIPTCSSQAYDAAFIMAAALQSAGTDPDKLADALRATKYDGVSGHIEFDGNGDVTSASYVVKRIADGTSTAVE